MLMSVKLPKLHLFPNKVTTNFLTITDRFPRYLHCQRFAREGLIISLSSIWQPRKGLPQNKASTKNGSLQRSLIHTNDAFFKGTDDKKLTACVLLNMSKAFVSVNRQILLVVKYTALAPQPARQNGLTATLKIDIKMYEFIVPFLIQ